MVNLNLPYAVSHRAQLFATLPQRGSRLSAHQQVLENQEQFLQVPSPQSHKSSQCIRRPIYYWMSSSLKQEIPFPVYPTNQLVTTLVTKQQQDSH